MHDRSIDVLDVSTQSLLGLLDTAREPILVRDLEGRILFWNQGCEALYGHGREVARHARAPELLATVFPAPMEEINARLLAQGHWRGEVTRRLADGREAVIDLRWSLHRDASGGPPQVLETGRDVTDSRKAEEALRRSEYRFRNVFHAMSVSFWELDFSALAGMFGALRARGVTSLRAHIAENPRFVREMMEASQVVDVNEKSLQLFEATREQLIGPVDRFWPPSSEHVFAASVIAALEKKPHYESEARFRTYDGREFDGLFTCCYPREYLPQGATLVGVIDITDRLRAQEDLQRVQAELAHAARISTLGELTASIAHEVNQPLSAIVTNGEAGLRWLKRPTPDLDEVGKAFDRMIAEANRASGVIGRIRTMAVKGEPETARLALAPLVEDAVLLVRRELATHGVALRVQVPADLPEVEGDRVQLQQVLVNLMVNGVQAMAEREGAEGAGPQGEGGDERVLTVRGTSEGEAVVLSVADTGPGVAPERLPQLFNAFYTTKSGGMGMGLSICKTIAQAHGGEIFAASPPEGGAVFSVRLPVAPDAQETDAQEANC